MSTLLSELVRKQVATGLIGIFSRTIDKVVEDLTQDVLRSDPAFRVEVEQLVRTAFQQALKELNDPAPPADDTPRHRFQQLDRLDLTMRDLQNQIRELEKKIPR